MMSNTKSRRDALKMSLGVVVGLPLVGVLNACTQCSKPAAETQPASQPTGAPASAATEMPAASPAAGAGAGGETLTLIAESDATATALNYKHDKANVPANLQQEKAGVPFAQQSCSTCMFYKAAGQLEGGEVGTCQLLAAGKVKSGGWCASWGKKA
jgi:hypothetical protein